MGVEVQVWGLSYTILAPGYATCCCMFSSYFWVPSSTAVDCSRRVREQNLEALYSVGMSSLPQREKSRGGDVRGIATVTASTWGHDSPPRCAGSSRSREPVSAKVACVLESSVRDAKASLSKRFFCFLFGMRSCLSSPINPQCFRPGSAMNLDVPGAASGRQGEASHQGSSCELSSCSTSALPRTCKTT